MGQQDDKKALKLFPTIQLSWLLCPRPTAVCHCATHVGGWKKEARKKEMPHLTVCEPQAKPCLFWVSLPSHTYKHFILSSVVNNWVLVSAWFNNYNSNIVHKWASSIELEVHSFPLYSFSSLSLSYSQICLPHLSRSFSCADFIVLHTFQRSCRKQATILRLLAIFYVMFFAVASNCHVFFISSCLI